MRPCWMHIIFSSGLVSLFAAPTTSLFGIGKTSLSFSLGRHDLAVCTVLREDQDTNVSFSSGRKEGKGTPDLPSNLSCFASSTFTPDYHFLYLVPRLLPSNHEAPSRLPTPIALLLRRRERAGRPPVPSLLSHARRQLGLSLFFSTSSSSQAAPKADHSRAGGSGTRLSCTAISSCPQGEDS